MRVRLPQSDCLCVASFNRMTPTIAEAKLRELEMIALFRGLPATDLQQLAQQTFPCQIHGQKMQSN
jgi:hypothetical protein